jgi:hypothetical protein
MCAIMNCALPFRQSTVSSSSFSILLNECRVIYRNHLITCRLQVLVVIDAATYARLTDAVAAVCAAGQSDLGAWGIVPLEPLESSSSVGSVGSVDLKSKPKPKSKPAISAASVAVALRDLEADVFAVIRSFATAAGLAAVLQNNGAASAPPEATPLPASSAHAATAAATAALEPDRAGGNPDSSLDSPEPEPSSTASQPPPPPPHVSVLARLLNIVAGNASASLRDVHVRFEDRLGAPEQPYALNVHLQSLSTGPRDRSFSPFRVVQYRACMADGLFVGLGGLPPVPASSPASGSRDADSAAVPLSSSSSQSQPSMARARRGSVSADQHQQQATRQRSASFISDGPSPYSAASASSSSASASAAAGGATASATAALLPSVATSFTSSPRQARPPLAAWSIAPALSQLAPVLRLHHLSVEICALMAPRALLLLNDGAADDAQQYAASSGATAQYYAAANSVESLRAVEKQPNVRVNVKLEEIHVTFSEVATLSNISLKFSHL